MHGVNANQKTHACRRLPAISVPQRGARMVSVLQTPPPRGTNIQNGNAMGKLDVHEGAYRLPTPIQAEAVPLILGGGDVLAAAETGSGKTGAFAMPVLQLVHETVRARAHPGAATSALSPAGASAPRGASGRA